MSSSAKLIVLLTACPRKRSRAFTLVEIISVVLLIAIIGLIGGAYMRDTTSTGRSNVMQRNADELNRLVATLQATGAFFQSGATANGTATTPARIQLNSTPSVAEKNAFIVQLEGAGYTSMGMSAALGKNITEDSYEYSWDFSKNIPVFSVVPGALVP